MPFSFISRVSLLIHRYSDFFSKILLIRLFFTAIPYHLNNPLQITLRHRRSRGQTQPPLKQILTDFSAYHPRLKSLFSLLTSVFPVLYLFCFSFDVGCSMFDVGRSSFFFPPSVLRPLPSVLYLFCFSFDVGRSIL
jgi:hypothetical protein